MQSEGPAEAMPTDIGKKSARRMSNFDGLRGLGIILVVLYHMGYSMARNAWMCISVFFCLSGLLITGVTVDAYERKGRVDVMRFWANRILRLFPALFLVIIFCSISRLFRDEDEQEFSREGSDLLWAVAFLTNYNLVFVHKDNYFDGFRKPSITRHLWTLSIEEQYYLCWPIALYGWTKMFPARKREREDKSDNDRKNQDMMPCLQAMCFGECLVIAFSYFSSLLTIQELGMSAAYYSTWSRMGGDV